jgi:cob(I)alamin adenosyltransferase
MVKITKVYTKTGDKGYTDLAGQHRVLKTSLRIEACGTIDELNANMGLVIASLTGHQALKIQCIRIQNELFNLGAQLVVLPEDRREDTPRIMDADVTRLEEEIDAMNKALPSLQSFILPGVCESSARFHVARTICRRAERRILALFEEDPGDEIIVPYINRLSDWLFVAARYCQIREGGSERLWEPNF